MRSGFLILSFLVLLANGLVGQTVPPRDPAYKLAWSDEFDRLDREAWSFEEGFQRNEELQWYQEKNASCRDGHLVIEARREKVVNPQFKKGSRSWRNRRWSAEYTSASLITRDPHQWTYGRFEIRARIQARAGLWPAIWTTGVGRWPHAGEIDIMEYYKDSILANVAWAGKNGKARWDSSHHPLKNFKDPRWDGKFHLWVMEWTPERIDLYLDGKLLNSTKLGDTVNGGKVADSPFHRPQRLRLNLAIGGNNGGDPSQTPFPARYLVDYVRIYQKPQQTK